MKNIVLLLLLFTGMVKAQIVNIPDSNFKAKLLSMGIDTNLDNNIQVTEAEARTGTFDISSASIQNLTGINAFVNINKLVCNYNLVTTANINLPNLTELQLFSNLLNSVTITNGTNIIGINLQRNNLTTFDFSSIPNVEVVYIDDNNINYLDFPSPLPALKRLSCSQVNLYTLVLNNLPNLEYLTVLAGDLITIDVSPAIHLKELKLINCTLGSLDVTALRDLQVLDCSYNPIRNLDVSQNPNLCQLGAANMPLLKTLNMKNGSISCLANVILTNNPLLRYVCGDEDELNYWQSYFPSNSMPSVMVGNYCNFFPGGNFNTITGNIKYDLDANGCDATDIIFPNIRVNLNDGLTQRANFTDVSGDYAFYTDAGTFEVAPVVENPAWFSVSPANATIPFADNNNNTTTQNFCISANGAHSDVEAVLSVVNPARPGFDALYKLVYRNKGTQLENATLSLNYDEALLNFINASQAPTVSTSGSIGWDISGLLPFQSGSITLRMHVNSPTDTPPVTNGTILNYTTSIGVAADENPADNTFTLHQTVVGSFDPNDIRCLEGNLVADTEIGNYLHYAINFENTGTAVAENVVVKTEVDLTDFDINTLQLMNSDYPVDARITDNKVEFVFKGIQLPIGGHGHILLKLKSLQTLVSGDAVANRADIFFDYNFPVDTGIETTVFQLLSNTKFETDSAVMVSPNPATDLVLVKADTNIQSVELYDVQGRIISTSIVKEKELNINISQHTSGIYFVKVLTEKGIKVQKLIKE